VGTQPYVQTGLISVVQGGRIKVVVVVVVVAVVVVNDVMDADTTVSMSISPITVY